jgi:hypothetical protein
MGTDSDPAVPTTALIVVGMAGSCVVPERDASARLCLTLQLYFLSAFFGSALGGGSGGHCFSTAASWSCCSSDVTV